MQNDMMMMRQRCDELHDLAGASRIAGDSIRIIRINIVTGRSYKIRSIRLIRGRKNLA